MVTERKGPSGIGIIDDPAFLEEGEEDYNYNKKWDDASFREAIAIVPALKLRDFMSSAYEDTLVKHESYQFTTREIVEIIPQVFSDYHPGITLIQDLLRDDVVKSTVMISNSPGGKRRVLTKPAVLTLFAFLYVRNMLSESQNGLPGSNLKISERTRQELGKDNPLVQYLGKLSQLEPAEGDLVINETQALQEFGRENLQALMARLERLLPLDTDSPPKLETSPAVIDTIVEVGNFYLKKVGARPPAEIVNKTLRGYGAITLAYFNSHPELGNIWEIRELVRKLP